MLVGGRLLPSSLQGCSLTADVKTCRQWRRHQRATSPRVLPDLQISYILPVLLLGYNRDVRNFDVLILRFLIFRFKPPFYISTFLLFLNIFIYRIELDIKVAYVLGSSVSAKKH